MPFASERADGEMRGAVSESSPVKDTKLSVSLTSEEELEEVDGWDPFVPPSSSPSPSWT
jgi:hypothetical protein